MRIPIDRAPDHLGNRQILLLGVPHQPLRLLSAEPRLHSGSHRVPHLAILAIRVAARASPSAATLIATSASRWRSTSDPSSASSSLLTDVLSLIVSAITSETRSFLPLMYYRLAHVTT
jgi:hypothetical protein